MSTLESRSVPTLPTPTTHCHCVSVPTLHTWSRPRPHSGDSELERNWIKNVCGACSHTNDTQERTWITFIQLCLHNLWRIVILTCAGVFTVAAAVFPVEPRRNLVSAVFYSVPLLWYDTFCTGSLVIKHFHSFHCCYCSEVQHSGFYFRYYVCLL